MTDLQWESIATEPPTSRRIEAARRANGHLLALAARSHSREREERLIGFLCECGCLATATSTSAEYEVSGGAWLADHKPG